LKIGKFSFGPRVFFARVFSMLGKIWFIPFGFYRGPILVSGTLPHPLQPRTLRDLILNKMMFPDTITRAIRTDKIAARGWVSERIGDKYIVPLYDICDHPDDLKTKNYPYPYVVKPNHGSGQFAFVKNDADQEKMLVEIQGWDYGEYKPATEWAYRDIKPKIMVEKMLVDQDQPETLDIKLYCFFGEAALIHYISDREGKTRKTFFTPDWELVDVRYLEDAEKQDIPKPAFLDEILQLTQELSDEFDFIRADFIICGGKIYFGELTSFPAAGTALFRPHAFDKYMFEKYQTMRAEKINRTRAEYHAAVGKMIKKSQDL